MKRILRISGKKHSFDQGTPSTSGDWTFELRPGGWLIGTRRTADGTDVRVRFFYSKSRAFISTKFPGSPGADLRGEIVPVSRAGASGAGVSDYTAQFPGKVRKVSIKEGDQVKEGTPLLMIEAMKMEFAIKAGASGVVKKIHVTEGMQLAPGQNLLDFEEQK